MQGTSSALELVTLDTRDPVGCSAQCLRMAFTGFTQKRERERERAPKEKFVSRNVKGKSATIWGSRMAVLGQGGLYRCHQAVGRSIAVWLCALRGPPPTALPCPLFCPRRVLEHVLHTPPHIWGWWDFCGPRNITQERALLNVRRRASQVGC